ncbi:hypothetical protein GCM10007049_08300 [Echinicola pacifica]|uniref:Uncharacterized protein n=1 Tax=Echinicola pacifica TaxID=346377 RepID=A0A918UL60_9BACT|nr:hypothetical protein [Echinicola pacifica]GGZ18471.1 hypothetical protein GCM10007049_08300 [Echinicola pacifica]
MKPYILLIFTCISFCSCNDKNTSADRVDQEGSFDWLLGEWLRTNDDEGLATYEKWHRSQDGYSGIGYTVKGDDTVKMEYMDLTTENGQWSLSVAIPGEVEATLFRMDSLEENYFRCINDSIYFPRKIEYWQLENELVGKVSNEDMEIFFSFQKMP